MKNIVYIAVPLVNCITCIAGISGFVYLVLNDHPGWGLSCIILSYFCQMSIKN